MVDFKSILKSKPHNKEYLDRYIELIETHLKIQYETGYEKHHICPKAKTMFPEYSNKTQNPWNIIKLPRHIHFHAHSLLAYAFPDTGMLNAYHMMLASGKNGEEYSKTKELLYQRTSIRVKRWIEEHGHPRGMTGKFHSEQMKQHWSSCRAGNKNPMYGRVREDLRERNMNPILAKEGGAKGSVTKINKKIIKLGFLSKEDAIEKLKSHQQISFTNLQQYISSFNDLYSMRLSKQEMLWLFGFLGSVRSVRVKVNPKIVSELDIIDLDFSSIF